MGSWVYVHWHGKKIKGPENKLSENALYYLSCTIILMHDQKPKML